jgi:hypothetical protein
LSSLLGNNPSVSPEEALIDGSPKQHCRRSNVYGAAAAILTIPEIAWEASLGISRISHRASASGTFGSSAARLASPALRVLVRL